jgi:hypothetical protein
VENAGSPQHVGPLLAVMEAHTAMDARRQFMQRLELAHLVLAVVAIALATWLARSDVVVGLIAGFAIGGGNARAMGMLAAAASSEDAGVRRRGVALLFVKMLVLMAVVGAVLYFLAPNPLAFVVAISAAPVLMLFTGMAGRHLLGAPEAGVVGQATPDGAPGEGR